MNEIPQELHIGSIGDLALPVFIAGVIVALAILLLAWLSRRNYLALPELKLDPAATPDHCVVIPARNEQASIARCVSSLDGSPRLVVDDHSSDRTAALAQAAGAEVRAAAPLPPKWLGKPHACWSGAQHTDSDWLAFVDANTWYEPGFLPSLLAYSDRRQLHAATVFPRQELQRWYERLLVPYGLGLYFTGVSAANVNNATRRDLDDFTRSLVARMQPEPLSKAWTSCPPIPASSSPPNTTCAGASGSSTPTLSSPRPSAGPTAPPIPPSAGWAPPTGPAGASARGPSARPATSSSQKSPVPSGATPSASPAPIPPSPPAPSAPSCVTLNPHHRPLPRRRGRHRRPPQPGAARRGPLTPQAEASPCARRHL